MVAAQQELTEEMKRLQPATSRRRRSRPSLVGGIPVDSEYIIFVIDTSGKHANYTWSLVVEKMAQTLDIYPQGQGHPGDERHGAVHVLDRYAGKWIPDTPARRKAILERLRLDAFSNSSPVEGITRAIQTFAAGQEGQHLRLRRRVHRCGPVTRPVAPERPISCPARVDSPSSTRISERWA